MAQAAADCQLCKPLSHASVTQAGLPKLSEITGRPPFAASRRKPSSPLEDRQGLGLGSSQRRTTDGYSKADRGAAPSQRGRVSAGPSRSLEAPGSWCRHDQQTDPAGWRQWHGLGTPRSVPRKVDRPKLARRRLPSACPAGSVVATGSVADACQLIALQSHRRSAPRQPSSRYWGIQHRQDRHRHLRACSALAGYGSKRHRSRIVMGERDWRYRVCL